jgi:hypothetical protein
MVGHAAVAAFCGSLSFVSEHSVLPGAGCHWPVYSQRHDQITQHTHDALVLPIRSPPRKRIIARTDMEINAMLFATDGRLGASGDRKQSFSLGRGEFMYGGVCI